MPPSQPPLALPPTAQAFLLSAVAEPIILTDAEGRLVRLNPAAEKIFFTASAEAQGQTLATLNGTLGQWFAEAARIDPPRPQVFEWKHGERTFAANLAPTSGYWIIVAQDITHLKQIEGWKSEAFQTAAHDLRNPVNLIAGALNFLADSLTRPTSAQKEYLAMLRTGVKRLNTLIESLLNLEQIESGVDVNRAPLALQPLVAQVVGEFKLAADEKHIRLEFEGAPQTGCVQGDEAWLQRALANLLSNALKYTLAGGRVQVRYSEADGQGRVEVSDTGPGIPTAAQARLFERFYRVRTEATKNAPGTGLGLAIVKTIVEKHQGRVWVSSEEGRGSTFGLALPLVAE